jgi:hypothetical protein
VGDPHSSARVCLDNPRGRRFAPTSQASETQLGKEQRQIVAPPLRVWTFSFFVCRPFCQRGGPFGNS